MESSNVRAVLFVKDSERVTEFYTDVLGLTRRAGDDSHAVLEIGGFGLIVHQIPKPISDNVEIREPPVRRVNGPLRLDFHVESVDRCRTRAKQLGGGVDEKPPQWASSESKFYLGFDPEGNLFGISQGAR